MCSLYPHDHAAWGGATVVGMTDCHICRLPMEIQGRMDINDEPWVALLCVDGHFVVLRESELPEGSVTE